MNRLLFLTLSIIFLTSCDPGLENIYEVENASNQTLTFTVKPNQYASDSTLTTTISAHSTKTIFKYGEIGTAKDKGNDFLEYFDTLEIKGTKDPIDPYDRNNWEFEINEQGLFTLDQVTYRLKIKK